MIKWGQYLLAQRNGVALDCIPVLEEAENFNDLINSYALKSEIADINHTNYTFTAKQKDATYRVYWSQIGTGNGHQVVGVAFTGFLIHQPFTVLSIAIMDEYIVDPLNVFEDVEDNSLVVNGRPLEILSDIDNVFLAMKLAVKYNMTVSKTIAITCRNSSILNNIEKLGAGQRKFILNDIIIDHASYARLTAIFGPAMLALTRGLKIGAL